MRSTDGGETWFDHAPGAQPDVHSVVWHPTGARAFEAGGGGAAWSDDGGATWQPADEGRDRHYTWAVAADPDRRRDVGRLGQHRAVRGARRRLAAGAHLPPPRRVGLGGGDGRAARDGATPSRGATVSTPVLRTARSSRATMPATRGRRCRCGSPRSTRWWRPARALGSVPPCSRSSFCWASSERSSPLRLRSRRARRRSSPRPPRTPARTTARARSTARRSSSSARQPTARFDGARDERRDLVRPERRAAGAAGAGARVRRARAPAGRARVGRPRGLPARARSPAPPASG